MSSLLQRRNKRLDDLKNSISILSIVRKAQQNHQSDPIIQNQREYNTCKDLMCQQVDKKDKNHTIKHSDSQTESLQIEIFKNGKTKQFQLDCPENQFEEIFILQQKIGQGAHGIVRKCIHKESNKIFALKILRMQDQHYRSIKTNFIYIKQLKHENIIKYKALYLNRQKRICRLVMQYSPYPSLKPGMDQNSLRFVFCKVLDALTYIHQKSICHRDIKPDNILCDIQKGIVKIIDFGVSKNMKLRGRYEEMLTNTGTCYYKAPEMFLGGSYTEKVDSWAVGITLFQLIAGHTPFESQYYSDTINNITSKQVWFDSVNFSNFSSLVRDLILRLLKKNPNERLTCQQAKKHLWFVPHLNDIDLMQSAVGFSIKTTHSEQTLDTNWFAQRRNSVKEIQELKPQKMGKKLRKSEKETMKRWLSVISEDNANQNENQYTFDFVESENEDEKESENDEKKSENEQEKQYKFDFLQNLSNHSGNILEQTTSLENIQLQNKDSIFTV